MFTFFDRLLNNWHNPRNRPLRQVELDNGLNRQHSSKHVPQRIVSVISFNSTYVEVVDYLFKARGGMAFIGIFGLLASMIPCVAISILFISKWKENMAVAPVGFPVSFAGVVIMFAIMAWMGYQCFMIDLFNLTHFPIRFNRKNRMVYFFERDGSVDKVPWDSVRPRYRYAPVDKNQTGDPLGHIAFDVVSEYGNTVRKTFELCNPGNTKERAMQLWEYVRLYMEEGPEIPYKATRYCLPILGRRMSFTYAVAFQSQAFPWALPLNWLLGAAMVASSYTCKFPVWPKDIEDECIVEPGDPYVKDWRNNPDDYLDFTDERTALPPLQWLKR